MWVRFPLALPAFSSAIELCPSPKMNSPDPEPTRGVSAPRLTARFRKAMVYASCLHASQTRKIPDRPTIGHLLGVASLVLQNGGDEDQAIAALLHDAIEDAGGSITLK